MRRDVVLFDHIICDYSLMIKKRGRRGREGKEGSKYPIMVITLDSILVVMIIMLGEVCVCVGIPPKNDSGKKHL